MTAKFQGRLLAHLNRFPYLLPGHLNYIEGWLESHLSEYPEHDEFTLIVTPFDMHTVRIELFDPRKAVVKHTGENLTPTMVMVGGEPPKENGGGEPKVFTPGDTSWWDGEEDEQEPEPPMA